MVSNLTFARLWFGHDIRLNLQVKPNIERRQEQIIRGYKKGYSIKRLAEKYGLSEYQVRQLLTSIGARYPKWRKATEDECRSIVEWHKAGKTYAEIAEIQGISQERVRRIIEAENETEKSPEEKCENL